MSLCSITGGRKLLGWRKKGDDRPFVKQKKPVLPIRGFKGNRVIYGDIFDVEDDHLESTPFEQDYQNKDIKSAEPLYSELDFDSDSWDSATSFYFLIFLFLSVSTLATSPVDRVSIQ